MARARPSLSAGEKAGRGRGGWRTVADRGAPLEFHFGNLRCVSFLLFVCCVFFEEGYAALGEVCATFAVKDAHVEVDYVA